MVKKAVVLLSGGLDSSTTLYMAKKAGYKCRCLVFNYGQLHEKEIKCAVELAKRTASSLTLMRIEIPWKASSLFKKADLKKNPWSGFGLPITYVPGRNTIFISYALSCAEANGASRIFIGANAVDYSGYPDCRPGYFKAWNALLKQLGTKVLIETPLIKLTKEQIIKMGLKLKVPYEHTWSCYKGGSSPCGVCDSCLFRAKGFAKAGLLDPSEKNVF